MRHELCAVDELEPGEVRSVKVDGIALAVVRTPDGSVHALRDVCPHYGAKLSGGVVKPLYDGTTTGHYEQVEGRYVLHCPWHGYEFSLDDGRCPADPTNYRVRSYDVTIEEGKVYVDR